MTTAEDNRVLFEVDRDKHITDPVETKNPGSRKAV